MKLTNALKKEATELYESTVEKSKIDNSDYKNWIEKIDKISDLCSVSNKTFIAALGNAILAKSLDSEVNVLALKASVEPNGYSARGLCQHVLAANAPRLGIDLGVTGREPLNNQPFFAKDLIHRELPVKDQEALNFLVDCLDELNALKSKDEAREIFRVFCSIRRKVETDYSLNFELKDSKNMLLEFIENFVGSNPEHGKRAQAVVAGVMDSKFENVEVDKIHDPDRNFPGDVVVKEEDEILLSVEVRDKPISENDIYLFAEKLIKHQVPKGAIVAVSNLQEQMELSDVMKWLESKGLAYNFFLSWDSFIGSILFWGAIDEISPQLILQNIFKRSVEMEVAEDGMVLFSDATISEVI